MEHIRRHPIQDPQSGVPNSPPPPSPTASNPARGPSAGFDSSAPPALARRRPSPPAPLLPLAWSAAFGILLEDTVHLPPWAAPALAALGLLLFCVLPSPRSITLLWCALCAGFFAGFHRVSDTLSPHRPPVAPALLESPLLNTPPPLTDLPALYSLQGQITHIPDLHHTPPSIPPQTPVLLTLTSHSVPSLLAPKTQLLLHWKGPPPRLGDLVQVRASVNGIPGPRNPGQFDRARFFRRQRLWLEATPQTPWDLTILASAKYTRIQALLCAFPQNAAGPLRTLLSNQLRRGIEDRPQTHALLTSMILGAQGEKLQEAREAFRQTGTLHLFAVSGLNLSMLSGFLSAFLTLLGIRAPWIPLVCLPVLCTYALATGLGPSCLRALLMSAFSLAAIWVQRPCVPLNSLGAAALLLLLLDTNHLFSIGFQLSFWLVFALLLATPPVESWLRPLAQPDPLLPRRLWSRFQQKRVATWHLLCAHLSVTVVAWVAGLPWNLFAFGQLNPIALLANLIAVPCAFLNMLLGFVALATAPLGPLTPSLNRFNAQLAEHLLSFLQWSAHVPGGQLPTGILGLSPPSLLRPLPTPALTVLDLEGTCGVLLQTPRTHCLLDCGSESQATSLVLPALEALHVKKLEAVLLSHGSAACIGGAIPLWERFRPFPILEAATKDRSLTRRHLHQWLQATRTPSLRSVSAGDILPLPDHASLEILYPPPLPPGRTAEDKGLVVRWKTPHLTVLYTARAGFLTEQWLLAHAPAESLHADLWIRAWNSRDPASSHDFLHAVRPRAVIASSPPKFSRHAQAIQNWIQSCRAERIPVFDQTASGAIQGDILGHTIRIHDWLHTQSVEWNLELPPRF